MKQTFMQVAFSLAVVLQLTCVDAAANQTSLPGDQKRLQAIEASMGPHYSPCGDFFKYACAEASKGFGYENIQVLDNHVRQEMKDIIESFRTIDEPKFLRAAYNYHQSCEGLDNEDPLEYLKWMNENENVSWPLVAPVNGPENDWIELLAITRKYGFNELFFHEDIVQRLDDPLKLTIEIKRPALTGLNEFSKQMYGLEDKLDMTSMQKFGQFQKELLKLTLELIKSEENDDVGFLLNTMSKTSDIAPQLVTLRDLQMPWLKNYLSVLLDQNQVDPHMQLYVHSVKYLNRIYEFVGSHDNRFLCDYIQIKFLKFLKDRDSLSRRGLCLQSTRFLFPLVMQWAYEQNHLELQWETQSIETLFASLKSKFKQTLIENTYDFSADVAIYLQAKLDNLQLMLGAMSSDDLEQYYDLLYLEPTEYYGNRLKVFNLNFQVSHGALSRTIQRNSMELLHLRSYESDGNIDQLLALSNLPHLYPRLNMIFLPVTMLQSPYYEYGMSDLYTYSSIGFLLAHEIAKAFDQRHLRIDANGIYNSAMYNKMQSNRKFQQSIQRLRKDFEAENHNTDEVIDDLGGLKLAYETFVELQPDVLQETVKINTELMTMEKVFFLNYAQNFCGRLCGLSTMGYFYYDLCDRVNMPVMHFNKFRNAFQCNDIADYGHPLWR